MASQLAKAIGLKYQPVAVLLTDTKPEKALQFQKGKWGCVMFLFANAAKGKTAVFDRETYGCWGGGVGLGFGNAYEHFPGGVECFAYFLSSGNEQWEQGRYVGQAVASAAGQEFAHHFLHGEGYVKNPALVHQWLQELPITNIQTTYVVMKPLGAVDLGCEQPETVIYVVDPDQLSALVILANYGREGRENVIIPWAAGCQTIGLLPFWEAAREKPRGVVGLTDISARKYVRSLLGPHYLTFAMPWRLFREMENNAAGSFLEKPTWQSLLKKKAD